MTLREAHTAEAANLAAVSDRKQYAFDERLLHVRETGNFWSLLNQLGISLAVSREYEHFIVLLSAPGGIPCQSALPLPHPSGISYDSNRRELIVSSTRTPNLIFWMRHLQSDDFARETVPAENLTPTDGLFLPYLSTLLPGSFYIHEIALMAGDLYATVTGHNFLARLRRKGGWERVWWPAPLEKAGPDGFRTNYFQLNGIARGETPENSYYTAFSDQLDGPKPWKSGYGPQGKGIVFSGANREVVTRGLTCPHSPRREGDRLWLCNSGFGEVGIGRQTFEPIMRAPGFTRGLALHDDYIFVGLSKVISQYESYAPGVAPEISECGIHVFHRKSATFVGSIAWPAGYQIFDVQVMPDMKHAILPFQPGQENEPNPLLRYLG